MLLVQPGPSRNLTGGSGIGITSGYSFEILIENSNHSHYDFKGSLGEGWVLPGACKPVGESQRLAAGSVAVMVFLVLSPIGFFAAEAWQAQQAVGEWLGNSERRLPALRRFPKECTRAFIARFLEAQTKDRPHVWLYLGDSTVYNSGIAHEQLFSTLISPKGVTPVVAGMLNASPKDGEKIGAMLSEMHIRPDRIFINLNQAWYRAGLAPNASDYFSDQTVNEDGTFTYCATRYRRTALQPPLKLPSAGKAKTEFQEVKLTPDRFNFDPRVAQLTVPPMLKSLRGSTSRLVAFVSPNAVGEFGRYGFSREQYSNASRILLDICRSIAGVVCLDLSESLETRHLRDIGHWNVEGNARMAALLRQSLGLDNGQ